MPTRISTRKWSLTLGLALMLACDAGKVGGATASPGDGPPKPEYETTFKEIEDLPNQLTAQVEWAAQPIKDAATLGDEVAALRASLNVDAATFESMCKVAFTDGKIEIGAQAELQDKKAEIEATLAKIKQVGADLVGIPGRVKVAGKNISKMVTGTPGLVLKASKDLSGQISTASGDTKVQLQADLDSVKALPKEVKAEAVELKNQLAGLPAEAKNATTNLLAAFAGKPVANSGGGGAAAAGGSGDAAGGGDASGGAATTEPTPAPAPTASTTPTPAPAASKPAPPPPPPPPPPSAAANAGPANPGTTTRVAMLQSQAKEFESRGDHLSAANRYEEAYFLDITNVAMTFEVGRTAWKAKDCERAMNYLDSFQRRAQKGQHDAQIAQSQTIMRELKTFDCPARTPEDEAAFAESLAIWAKQLSDAGDWGGAAARYAEAYQVVPDDHVFAYHVAIASWEGHECGDAGTYLHHFEKVADPRKHRRELKETKKKIALLDAGECPAWAPGQKDAHARELFSQAQDLERKLDYRGAVDKYERAYVLLPQNHAFAWRIAEAAWLGYDCPTADEYLRKFVAGATDPKLAGDVQKANGYIARIDAAGCPGALWTEAGAAAGGGGDGGSAGGEAPPPLGLQGRRQELLRHGRRHTEPVVAGDGGVRRRCASPSTRLTSSRDPDHVATAAALAGRGHPFHAHLEARAAQAGCESRIVRERPHREHPAGHEGAPCLLDAGHVVQTLVVIVSQGVRAVVDVEHDRRERAR